jgi:hypothetical protein
LSIAETSGLVAMPHPSKIINTTFLLFMEREIGILNIDSTCKVAYSLPSGQNSILYFF